MDIYKLKVQTKQVGGYFSSEQIDLLSIIQCKSKQELIDFIKECQQLHGMVDMNRVDMALEELKRFVFRSYQESLMPHYSDPECVLKHMLERLGLKEEEIEAVVKTRFQKKTESLSYIKEYIKNRYPNDASKIFRASHQIITKERDQNKDPQLYDELVLLNDHLPMFQTLLVGSGKPEVVINFLFSQDDDRFDFYFSKRDLDFAHRNNKHVRFHTLLTRGTNLTFFDGMKKDDILDTLKSYVKYTIDFISEYNNTHKLTNGDPVINAIDVFNEIVSFEKNQEGQYENIWEVKYGISIKEFCDVFSYAIEHRPEGVTYLYNEPFLENKERREKVFEVLKDINLYAPGFIDTLGSQMHITFQTSDEQIEECFQAFKSLQDVSGVNIQITEFDLSLSEKETRKLIDVDSPYTCNQVYAMKKERIDKISSIIVKSGVRLDGISYWSLTDRIDCNLERVRTRLLDKGIITDTKEITSVCGGMLATLKEEE